MPKAEARFLFFGKKKTAEEIRQKKLRKDLKSRDIKKKRKAVRELDKMRDVKLISDLISAADDEDVMVRRVAVRSLGKFDNEQSKITLRRKAKEDKDSNVRAFSIRALGKLKDKESKSLIIQSLNDKELVVKIEAIRALGEIGGNEAILELRRMLESQDVRVRLAAAESLGKLGDKTGLSAVLEIIKKSKSIRQRVKAILALREIEEKSDEVRQVLKDALNDKDERVREAAKISLSFLGFE